MKKRSGSHWELYDCGSGRTEERRTAKAVCTTDGSAGSNCKDVYKGFGVAGTIVEMPSGCGPGRYAVAVALEHTQNQTLPHHLVKRGVSGRIYDFTFDYDFSPIMKRADSKTLLRIDYSDDPGFWTKVVGV
jgi:chitinase